MSPTIKEVYDKHFEGVKFDRKFCERLIRYSEHFMVKNDDHSEFFGGVLLGVNPIRFLQSDRDEWYEEVLGVDDGLLSHDFKTIESINHDFKVMGDPFNYTPIYVAYRLKQTTGIPRKLQREAMVHAFMVLHYRFLTSLLVQRFRYPANKEVALATFMSLSGRFDIRKYGSWRALLMNRAEGIIDDRSIYKKALDAFSPDEAVIRVVTDTQTRIREVVSKIYSIHIRNSNAGIKMRTTSDLSINTDGEMVLNDKVNGYSTYLRYAHQVIGSESDFIREELIQIISAVMNTMPRDPFVDSLRYLSRNYQGRNQEYLEEVVEELLLYVFDFLQKNRSTLGRSNDLALVLTRLKSLLVASRSSDPAVLKLRKQTESFVKKAIKSRNNAVIASVRTGVLLYIAIRILTRQNYVS